MGELAEGQEDLIPERARHALPDGSVLRVMGNHLFVEVDAIPDVTAGGIHIPGNAVDTLYNTGKVVALGWITGPKAPPHCPIPGLKKGDNVLFVRYHAQEHTNQYVQRALGKEVIRLRPADVLLVFDDEDLPKFRRSR